jgi:hypothetical protein
MGTVGTLITTTLITKTDIESFINDCMEDDIASTSLAEAIKLCLRDLSNIGLLQATDSSIDLDDTTIYFNIPTDCKNIETINLTDSSGNKKEPLVAFPGGHSEYLECMADSTSTSTPEYYSESQGKVYLYPPSDDDYDVVVEYQKYDNQDPDNIEFGGEFSNALKFGSLYFYAMMKGRERYVSLWGQKYEVEKEFRRLNLKKPVYITR